MRFGVLGPLAVWTASGEPVTVREAKVRLLLAGLLVHRGRPVSADRLVEELWGGAPPRDALAALRVKVSQLRGALADRDAVRFRAAGYVLDVPADALDAERFQALLATPAADPRARAAALTEALDLWRGPAYAGLSDVDLVRPAAAKLEEQRLAALEELGEARLALGEPVEVGDLVAEHPLRERLRAVHMRALYRAGRQSDALAAYADLRERLAGELGLNPSPELADLHARILRQDPALQAPARVQTNLPAPVTALIGRESALSEVRALLADNRLVTLTGPGGVGKTRLALAAASASAAAFPDGTWLAELATIPAAARAGDAVQLAGTPAASRAGDATPFAGTWATPCADGVAQLLGEVLGLPDHGPDAMADRVAAALAGRRALLVLDNCEHVVEQVAPLVRKLLQSAPELRVLATSQETLRVTGETAWSVPPLGREAAIELFSVRAGGGLAGDEAVAEICARLDGIPLAVELAAARARALTPRQLADRLDDRFRLLSSGMRDAPARQRTLRAMIDWSWELLTEPERLVLRRLAVHADGCTLEAAEQMCAEPGHDVLDLLARLVDRSLVVGGARFRLLESVAAYAAERLEEAGETALVRRRHLDHHVALAERAEPYLRGREQQRWLEILDAESGNLRAALDTAAAHGPAAQAHRLVRALTWYWVLRGRLGEARRSLEIALALGEDPETRMWWAGVTMLSGELAPLDPAMLDKIDDPARRARLGWFLGMALFGFEEPTCSDSLLAPALRAFEELGDTWGVAAVLSIRGKSALLRGDLGELRANGERSLELFQRVGDRWGQNRAAENLSTLAEISGDYPKAAELRRASLRVAEELGLWASVTDSLSKLGRIALLEGDFARADDYHERARRSAVEQANRPAEEDAELGLALSARRQGRLDDAERLLLRWLTWVREMAGEPGAALMLAELGFIAELRGHADPANASSYAAAALTSHLDGLAAARAVGDPRATALALEGVAGVRALQGRHEEAASLLGQATALREGSGAPLPPGERGDVDRIAACVLAGLGEQPYMSARARGAALSLPAALDLARSP
ncbi:BTAD domain-containing putative transcriptional regulator [Nonomuraea typhae]|uniref:BTAD domain-containing putative transcriptional regulator n=1 Tax=Nonomuraea typhae TaxID=2603600 RepID=UPI0012FAF4F7|nr:BTAD domain-containing putative transcriptional regulator [Nonomuraea typhae]